MKCSVCVQYTFVIIQDSNQSHFIRKSTFSGLYSMYLIPTVTDCRVSIVKKNVIVSHSHFIGMSL